MRTALRRALAPSGAHLALGQDTQGEATADTIPPDAIVLDTALPGLDGLDLLRQITAGEAAVPVIVVALDTPKGRGLRAEAMRGGAAAFVLRPDTERPLALKTTAEEILALIASGKGRSRPAPAAAPEQPASNQPAARALPGAEAPAARVHQGNPSAVRTEVGRTATTHSIGATEGVPRARASRGVFRPRILVVASSTGGPQALIDMFRAITPGSVPLPVLVVQHMPAAFTPILAEHLSRASAWRAKEAADGDPLTAGEIRIAPGGHHMLIAGSGASRRLKLTDAAPVNFCRPSADVLFTSAAQAFGRDVLAVILTGMGNDGAEGAKVIAAAGGMIVAQDKETSVVWGMPGAAVATGVVDQVIPLAEMPKAVMLAAKGGA